MADHAHRQVAAITWSRCPQAQSDDCHSKDDGREEIIDSQQLLIGRRSLCDEFFSD